MKLRDINLFDDSYTYSTSYRFCFPFTFAPFTTVGPLDGNFSKAISFMWHRKSRRHLEDLHHEVMQAATEHKLVRLYRLSVLAFTFTDTYNGERGSIAALKLFADGARDSGDDFAFSPFVLSCLRSFAPILTWRTWEDGLIDLAPGDIVKVVTPPENGMCHVNKPGKFPVIVTMELVDPEWLEPVNGRFKECEYCGAIDHETSDCPYRGKVPYGRKGNFSWRIEDGKTIFE